MHDNNSLVRNSLYNIIYRGTNIVFPLVTSIYVAHVLFAESIGRVTAAQNIASYFTVLAAMGIPTYGTKLIAQYKIGSYDSTIAYSELFEINLVLSLVCTFSYYTLITVIPFFSANRFIYYLTGLAIVFNIFNVDWYYQGIQKFDYIAKRNMVTKILSLICLFVFVKSQKDYIVYAAILTGGTVGNYLLNILSIGKYVQLTFADLKLKHHFKPILVLFLATIAAEIYTLADTTMLNVMCNALTVGYYTISLRFVSVLRGIATAISAVFLPQLSKLYFNGETKAFEKLANNGLNTLIRFAIPVSVGTFLLCDDAICMVFGNEFKESILATRIMAASIISVAISNYVGLQLLVTLGQEKITTVSTMIGAVINISLNSVFISLYQQNGAAFASMITEASVMFIQIFLAGKFFKFKLRLINPLIAVIVMTVCIISIRIIFVSGFVRLILCFIIGVISYGTMLMVFKDEYLFRVLQHTRSVNTK